MKVVLAVVLIVLLLLVALPMGMGMHEMADCPACVTSKAPFALGVCAGILSLLILAVLLSGTRFRLATDTPYRFLLSRLIYRPPRFA